MVVPVYNRPDELRELLESLRRQTWKNFEVVVVEDGSITPSDQVVGAFRKALSITYVTKKNSGQGFSRNVGFEHAKGDLILLMDSDCIVDSDYMQTVAKQMESRGLDAFGGPDKAHPSFTLLQKAINFSMTSFWTTGGIRNRTDGLEVYHPRSFNMGFRRGVLDKIGGFAITRMGEDIEFSERILRAGFKVGLIEEAYVYHKRRTTLWAFARQAHFFGRARVNVWRFYPDQLKLVHLAPLGFLLALTALPFLSLIGKSIGLIGEGAFSSYSLIVFLDALRRERSITIAILGLVCAYVQLTSYGLGMAQEFLQEALNRLRRT